MPDESSTLRRCQICKTEKPLDAYHVSRGHPLGRTYRCKACLSARQRTPEGRARAREINQRRYERAKAAMIELKSRPCADCGGSFPPYVMEFDHPDRTLKTGNISSMIGGGHLAPKFLDELAKTTLVCANCHRIRTRRQFEAGEWKAGRPRLDAS